MTSSDAEVLLCVQYHVGSASIQSEVPHTGMSNISEDMRTPDALARAHPDLVVKKVYQADSSATVSEGMESFAPARCRGACQAADRVEAGGAAGRRPGQPAGPGPAAVARRRRLV